MPDRVRGLSRTFSSQAEEADQDAQVSMLASQEMSDNSSVKMGEESFRHQNVSFQKEVMEEETFPVEPQGQPALIKRLSTKIKDFRRKVMNLLAPCCQSKLAVLCGKTHLCCWATTLGTHGLNFVTCCIRGETSRKPQILVIRGERANCLRAGEDGCLGL